LPISSKRYSSTSSVPCGNGAAECLKSGEPKLDDKCFQAILEDIPSAVVIVEAADQKFSYVNKRAIDIYGINYVGYDLDAYLAKVKAVKLDGTPFPFEEMPINYSLRFGQQVRNVEMIIQKPDGTQVPVLVNSAPLFNAQREITAAVVTFDDITERKKAEKLLQTTLCRFYRTLSSMHGSILLVSPEGRVEFVNQSFCDYFSLTEPPEALRGLTSEETIKKIEQAYVHPKEQLKRINEIILAGKPVLGEEVEMRGNRTCLRDFIPLYKDEASFSRLWHHMDITERKKTEEKVKRQNLVEQGINRILYSALTAKTEEDLGQICLAVAQEITASKIGFIGEINEQGLQDIAASNPGWDACKTITPQVHCSAGNFEIHGVYGKVLTGGKGFFTNDIANYPGSVGLPAGHPPIMSFLGVPLISEGKTIGMIAVANREGGYSQDELEALVTLSGAIVEAFSRKRAEAQLNNYSKCLENLVEERTRQLSMERQRLYNMLEGLPVMVCLLTEDYNVAFANRAFREKYGEPKGKRCYDYFRGENMPCSFCESYEVLRTGKSHHWVATMPDGSILDAYDFLFIDVDGSRMVLEMDVDISQRVTLEKQVKVSERLAAIGATAGMVGHDLRNPLQTVVGEIYLARKEVNALPESEAKASLQESISAIEQQIMYMDKIVSDLQMFVKPVSVLKKPLDLVQFIPATLMEVSIPANVKLSKKIPAQATVAADPLLLKRVLLNLLNNAIQAMPKGGELTVEALNCPAHVQVTVEDTGVGISEAIKDKIFVPLFTTKSKGQGFGLAVCKRVIEAHGGTIGFESTEGKGAKFTISLPTKK
jgi:nitrogen fixation/metabolism regulation signal transduction histidine kinase